jgi:hypothetical protein
MTCDVRRLANVLKMSREGREGSEGKRISGFASFAAFARHPLIYLLMRRLD